jgi:hypothetical protein
LSEPKSLKPPTATSGDAAHLAARLAVSAVPSFGGPGLELFNAIIAPPVLKAWQNYSNKIEVPPGAHPRMAIKSSINTYVYKHQIHYLIFNLTIPPVDPTDRNYY